MNYCINRKAVSPVIATVILVAIAITISVAVAYWMGGISSQYTKFEKVEITTATCEYLSDPIFVWNVTVNLKNTGTSSATIINVFINDVEVDTYGAHGPVAGEAVCSMDSGGITLESGSNDSIILWIRGSDNGGNGAYRNLSAGTTINIKLHSANGMDYFKMFTLT